MKVSQNGVTYKNLIIDDYSAGGDLSGTYPLPTVNKIRNTLVAAQSLGAGQNNYVLTYSHADGYYSAKPSSSGGGTISDGYQHLNILSGLESSVGAGSNIFSRVGSIIINSSNYPVSPTVIFESIFEVTTGQTGEVRLFNLTLGTVVSNSTLTTTSLFSNYNFSSISLASGSNIYEVQIRIINASPGSSDGIICSNARIRIQ